jgi:hypothetical protein
MFVTTTSLSSITLDGHLNDVDLYGTYMAPLFAIAFTTTLSRIAQCQMSSIGCIQFNHVVIMGTFTIVGWKLLNG